MFVSEEMCNAVENEAIQLSDSNIVKQCKCIIYDQNKEDILYRMESVCNFGARQMPVNSQSARQFLLTINSTPEIPSVPEINIGIGGASVGGGASASTVVVGSELDSLLNLAADGVSMTRRQVRTMLNLANNVNLSVWQQNIVRTLRSQFNSSSASHFSISGSSGSFGTSSSSFGSSSSSSSSSQDSSSSQTVSASQSMGVVASMGSGALIGESSSSSFGSSSSSSSSSRSQDSSSSQTVSASQSMGVGASIGSGALIGESSSSSFGSSSSSSRSSEASSSSQTLSASTVVEILPVPEIGIEIVDASTGMGEMLHGGVVMGSSSSSFE